MKIDQDFMEKVIFFHALTNEEYLVSVIDHLTPDVFENNSIRDIITIISEFHSRNNAVPTVTEIKSLLTTDELRNAFKTSLNDVATFDKNVNKEELIKNTETFIKERKVYHTLLETAKTLGSGDVDTSIILDKFEKACNINLNIDHGIELYGDIDKIIRDINKVDPVISTGWDWMDKILGGGFLKDGRALYVYAGRPNVGKSIFLGNIASNISSAGNNVLVISLEMSEMIYARRLCSNVTAIPLSELKYSAESLRSSIKRQDTRGKIYIKEFPPSTITPKQVVGFVKKMIGSGIKIDAIVIDYLNLLASPVGSNLYEKVKYACEQLRAMTYIFNCPVITATQLNRGGFYDENPGLDTLSESAGVAATADFIMGIWQDDEDKEFGTLHGGIMKNRFGSALGVNKFSIDYSTLILSELGEEDISSTSESMQIYNSLHMLSDD